MRKTTRPSNLPVVKFCKLSLLAIAMGIVPRIGYSNSAEEAGLNISRNHCSRCHIVESGKPFSGISSTPSFSLLVNGIANWEERFSTFYVLRPHPAFTRIEGLENPLAKNPTTVPMDLNLEDVDNILSYVRTLKKSQ